MRVHEGALSLQGQRGCHQHHLDVCPCHAPDMKYCVVGVPGGNVVVGSVHPREGVDKPMSRPTSRFGQNKQARRTRMAREYATQHGLPVAW